MMDIDTAYLCAFCNLKFRASDYGELVGSTSIKAYQAVLAHMEVCAQNPKNIEAAIEARVEAKVAEIVARSQKQ